MSTRWIAGIGLVLCAAMTSFSVYLGAVENVYRAKAPRSHAVAEVSPRAFVCNQIQFRTTTTTTGDGPIVGAIPCARAGR